MHRPTQSRTLSRYITFLLGSLASIHLGTATIAQAEEATRHYTVAAQPLSGALTEFAEEANLKLMFPAKLARGIASPGVTGALTPDKALARLLAGTGLTYRYTSPDTVTLERPDPLQDLVNEAKQPLRVSQVTPEKPRQQTQRTPEADTTTKLPEMTVTAKPTDDTSYNPPNATTATKTDTPIMETPFSIQVIPQQVFKDQQVTRIDQALETSAVSTGSTMAGTSTASSFEGSRI